MKKKNKVVKTIVIALVVLLLFTSVYSVVEVYASDKDKKSNNSTPLPIETIKTYTVTFDSRGGSKVSSITVNENETINLPDILLIMDILLLTGLMRMVVSLKVIHL